MDLAERSVLCFELKLNVGKWKGKVSSCNSKSAIEMTSASLSSRGEVHVPPSEGNKEVTNLLVKVLEIIRDPFTRRCRLHLRVFLQPAHSRRRYSGPRLSSQGLKLNSPVIRIECCSIVLQESQEYKISLIPRARCGKGLEAHRHAI